MTFVGIATSVGIGTFAAGAVGVGLAASGAASLYGAVTNAGVAGDAESIAANQASKQNTAFNQLQTLLNNPQSFFSSPVYTAAANQGGAQVARQNAAAFGPNSGNEATALQAYGQSFGQQQLLSQEQLLAGMSGTQYNPSSSLQVASGAASSSASSLSSLGGLLSFFGNSGMAGGASSLSNSSWQSQAISTGFG